MTGRERCFGKYRGTCLSTDDPAVWGRIQVRVADVRGAEVVGWAMPCVPLAGSQVGMLALPTVGAAVWVEFERGDPDRPIWVGGFWRDGEMPDPLADIAPGGVAIRTASGATVSATDAGVLIDGGEGASITVTGTTVEIRESAAPPQE